MPSRDRRALKLLEDIRETADFLVHRTAPLTFTEVFDDVTMRLAVERSFEIIGEAMRRLRDERLDIRERLRAGAMVIGARNHIAHGYDDIDYEVLWSAIRNRMPELVAEVERRITELGG